MAKADQGQNPAAKKTADGLYQFTLLESASYTISAWEDLSPQRAAASKKPDCAPPSRIDASPVVVSGSDPDAKELTLVFLTPVCATE